jgi:FkbM family methyltransferase
MPSTANDDLTRLFDRAAECAERLERSHGVDVIGQPDKPTLLLGCGHLGQTTRARLQSSGTEIAGFVDNDPRKWGGTCAGLPVMSLQMAVERFGPNVPLVNCVYTGRSMEIDLKRRGYNILPYSTLAFSRPDVLIPHGSMDNPAKLAAHRSKILEASALWSDDVSREEYLAQIRFRATLDGPMPPFLDPATTYFPEDVVELKRDEVFVDCGAFDGDSIRSFLRRSGGWFGGAVGIEADPENAGRLKSFVGGLPKAYADRIRVVEAAVGAEEGTISFQVTGTAESTFVGSTQGRQVQVPCRPLDKILANDKPSYVKMDIEGAEPLALAGAADTIRKNSPVLAVCLYHDFAHLWEIPLQIRAISDGYEFYLRRYSDDVWEQVCYAVPKSRVRR